MLALGSDSLFASNSFIYDAKPSDTDVGVKRTGTGRERPVTHEMEVSGPVE